MFLPSVYAIKAPVKPPSAVKAVNSVAGLLGGKNSLFLGSTTLEMYVHEQSDLFGVNPELADCLISHESQWIPDKTGPEVKGASEGLWQIDLYYHPTITKAQADDVKWATNWALTQIAAGRINWWATYSAKPFYCKNIPVFK